MTEGPSNDHEWFYKRSTPEYQQACNSIGNFIISFSQLEAFLRGKVAAALAIEPNFREVAMTAFDFAMLCSVAREVVPKAYPHFDKKTFNKLISTCMALNTERVRIAHGTWATSFGVYAFHTQRGKSETSAHFGNSEAITKLALQCQSTLTELTTLEFRDAEFPDYNPRS